MNVIQGSNILITTFDEIIMYNDENGYWEKYYWKNWKDIYNLTRFIEKYTENILYIKEIKQLYYK